MRRKRVELEQAVIVAARGHVQCVNGSDLGVLDSYDRMEAAVVALDEYEAAEITGAGARWVEGSPETSAQAAGLAEPVQNSTRHAIVGLLAHPAQMSLPGYTDEELERRTGRSHQTVSSARNWLVNAGWVIDSGQRRRTRSRRKAVVWTLSPAAWEKLRNQ